MSRWWGTVLIEAHTLLGAMFIYLLDSVFFGLLLASTPPARCTPPAEYVLEPNSKLIAWFYWAFLGSESRKMPQNGVCIPFKAVFADNEPKKANKISEESWIGLLLKTGGTIPVLASSGTELVTAYTMSEDFAGMWPMFCWCLRGV